MREEIRGLLEREGYVVVDYSDVKSSVDFIAKRGKEVLVVRVLGNLDALRPEHAHDIVNLARILDGTAIVVAEKSRWGPLKDGVIYYRHGVPALSPRTFQEFLEGNLPRAVYVRGKEIVELDSEKLRRRRKELGLSLQRLAELLGTTKETIYRYEHGYYATSEMADRLKEVLGVDLRRGIRPAPESTPTTLHYPFNVLKSLGGEIGEFRRLPWEALGRRKLIISFIRASSVSSARRRLKEVAKAKGKVFNYYLFIGKRLKGLPHIEEEEILEAENYGEIEKIARERNEES